MSNTNQTPIAALAIALTPGDGHMMQIFPAGEFSAPKGALRGAGPWHIDGPSAANLLENIAALKNPIVVDYEHQSILTNENGKPAPAAGWLDRAKFKWIDGQGFYHSEPDWTPAATAAIRDGEYRYVSAVFPYDPATGHPLDLISVALTNQPAIDDMRPLAAASARLPQYQTQQDNSMDDLLPDIRWMLSLPLAATVAEIKLALNAALAQLPGIDSADLSLAVASRKPINLVAALTAKTVAQPDPAKFAPVAVLSELQAEVATLRTQINVDRANVLLSAALSQGKIASPAKRAYANSLAGLDDSGNPIAGAKPNLAALSAYLSSEDANPALIATQTRGKTPEELAALAAKESELTKAELAICKNLGADPEKFKAQKIAQLKKLQEADA